MGSWSGRRMEPRVEFRRDVRVIWSGQVGGVVAQAVNLSPTGILVDAPTPTPCEVGSDVLCDLALPRGSRLLRGRVAHRRELPSEKVGMGIEFVDLSPRMVAELRDVVGASEEELQPIKVRFGGTRQIVSARALPTADGFRFATPLPFLRADAEVEVALSPDARISTRGWVSGVVFDESADDGVPRLVIDVHVEPSGESPDDAATVETPPPVAMSPFAETPPPTTPIAFEASVPMQPMPAVPTQPLPMTAPSPAHDPSPDPSPEMTAVPTRLAEPAEPERTEIVRAPVVPREPVRKWRGRSLLAVGIGFAAFALVVLSGRFPPLRRVAPPLLAPRPAPPAAPAPSIVALAPPAPTPVEALPDPIPEQVAEPPAPPSEFTVGLAGSLAGAVRYPLRAPDGVAFNLPHARATMRVGTYRPAIAGLGPVWVRALPGGGAHLRFFFSGRGPEPKVELGPDGVRVTAR